LTKDYQTTASTEQNKGGYACFPFAERYDSELNSCALLTKQNQIRLFSNVSG